MSTSGFDGNHKQDRKDFVDEVIKVVKNDLTRPKSQGSSRYKLRVGQKNGRIGLLPEVSTTQGIERIIIWNIPDEKTLEEMISRITEELEGALDVRVRPYLWFGDPPDMLPGEFSK